MGPQAWILTGENNHDWPRTSAHYRQLLQSWGFAPTVQTRPAEALCDPTALRAVRLFLIDYNGTGFGEAAERAFADAVASGAGVVAIHASSIAFAGWTAYEDMLALAWRSRGGHGAYHPFTVRVVDHDHPVTAGLQDFRTTDELYHGLERVGRTDYRVLCSAFSDPQHGGTGREEPMAIVTAYGSGRVFHTPLGHVWPDPDGSGGPGTTMTAVETPGFRALVRAGSLWAARLGEGR